MNFIIVNEVTFDEEGKEGPVVETLININHIVSISPHTPSLDFVDAETKSIVRDSVKVVLQVGIDHISVACFEQSFDPSEGVFASSPGAKAIGMVGKVDLKDRLQDVDQRRLHNPISHRGNAQWALFRAAWFGDENPSNGLGTIRALSQGLSQSAQVLLQPGLKHRNRLMVYSGSPFVGLHLLEGCLQILRSCFKNVRSAEKS